MSVYTEIDKHKPFEQKIKCFLFKDNLLFNETVFVFWMHFFTGDHVAKTLDPPSSLRADNLPDVYLGGSSIQVRMISSKPACPKSIECQASEILK